MRPPPRHQGTKIRNLVVEPLPRPKFLLPTPLQTRLFTTPQHSRNTFTARIARLASTTITPNIQTRPSMGSASPAATPFFLTAQLTAVGSLFPYSALSSGLNKTDASFASLVRQVGFWAAQDRNWMCGNPSIERPQLLIVMHRIPAQPKDMVFAFDQDDAHLPSKMRKHAEPAIASDQMFASERMDMSPPKASLHVGTPPITIASPMPKRTAQPNSEAKLQGPDKLDFDAVFKKAQKNKRKKKKGLKDGLQATNVTRGFHTPVTSGGEESDYSFTATPRFGPVRSALPSVTSSPALRPQSAIGGISNLKAQLEALNLAPRSDSPMKDIPARGAPMSRVASHMSSNTSVSGQSDRTELESYEIDLSAEDFSIDMLSKTSTMLNNTMARKMTAEDFEPLMCLGKGSYGTVLLVRQRATGRLFAQKQFKKASITVHKKLIEQTKTERNVLESLEYGAAVDWWSLGALGFDLLTGSPPFTGNNNAKIQEKIVKQKLALPYYLSADAKDLLTRFLRKDPKKRLGFNRAKDLQTIKKHRFFRKINWKALEARELEPPIQPLITDPELAENFAQDFTNLPLSPVLNKKFDDAFAESQTNPFGGFSFVASQSLLDAGEWGY
ncbi:serine threonine- kinase psk1 [Pyrenophora seminiperda CCB06]|uniref:Serine threonine-kinase psk1 n=1 Tax=Pyrenophora seminiperda CCB06 TaxID=1302712 RepID=A0A3M7MB50_9PLEO|nr:serine threonine- kinase psk1 [Pyrenophora seminiperda CCB06]